MDKIPSAPHPTICIALVITARFECLGNSKMTPCWACRAKLFLLWLFLLGYFILRKRLFSFLAVSAIITYLATSQFAKWQMTNIVFLNYQLINHGFKYNAICSFRYRRLLIQWLILIASPRINWFWQRGVQVRRWSKEFFGHIRLNNSQTMLFVVIRSSFESNVWLELAKHNLLSQRESERVWQEWHGHSMELDLLI